MSRRDDDAPAGQGLQPKRTDAEPAGGETGAAAASKDVIGAQLKSMFAELTAGSMPDRLLALVDELEAKYGGDEPSEDPAERGV